MFEITQTDIPNCFKVASRRMEDARGWFVKTYHAPTFKELGLQTDWNEEYYSVSRKGVLRGLHFQLPPHDHEKIVYCASGEVLDVVVDLRVGSPMYGRHEVFNLSSDKATMIYIPKGCAHGFYTKSDSAIMMYKVSSVYAPDSDAGILWSSLDIAWPSKHLIISDRDKAFAPFNAFVSPFYI